MVHRAALVLLAWLCLLGAGAAQTPSFPALTGRVVDQAGLLPEADRAALTEELAALEAKTHDQLVVVTLKSLQGTPIEEYGYQLGRHWGIGQKGTNSGALLIVSAENKQVRIEVGYGLEGTLTDAATKVIIETAILPRFKAGDFPGGIRAGTAQIVSLLAGDAEAATPAQDTAQASHTEAPQKPLWPFIALGLCFVVLLIACAMIGGFLCQTLFQILTMVAFSGRGSSNSPGGGSSFSGGGGSFGGGGSSGSW